MRWIVLGIAAFMLVACVEDLSEEQRLARCVDFFKDYDRELRFDVDESAIVRRVVGEPIGFDRELSIRSALLQYRCETRLDDLPDLDAVASGLQAYRGDGAGQLAVPEYLHAGLARDGRVASALTEYFTGLGYRVRTTGAPGLGRRVFVGPLETVEARRGAETVARAAGLGTTYTVTRLPWPR